MYWLPGLRVKAADLFYVGIVADDPEAGVLGLSGYEWGEAMGDHQAVTLTTGNTDTDLQPMMDSYFASGKMPSQ